MANKTSFDKSWENNIYSKKRHLNLYPYDILVSIVARKFFHFSEKERRKIRVLDLGCGVGNNAKFLAENGFDVCGIDGSKSAIEICKERFKKWGLKASFIHGDFINLPYKNNFFDLAIDRESLCANKFADIKKITGQVYSKLKRKGIFVSFFYNSHHPDKEFGKKIEPNTFRNFSEGSFYNTGTIHFLDMKEISELFSQFKIRNVIRHSLIEEYDKTDRFLEFDEYIIIAEK